MFDKLVAGVITSYLGNYFENIDTEQVKVSLWGGNVRLQNLRIRRDALRQFDSPLFISSGTIVNLEVVIPWSRLQSESVVMKIRGVHLVLEHKNEHNYPPEQSRAEAAARQEWELQAHEEVLLSEWVEEQQRWRRQQEAKARAGTGETASPTAALPPIGKTGDEAASENFSTRLKASMLNNIRVEIEDFRIRYKTSAAIDAPLGVTSEAQTGSTTSVVFSIDKLASFACNSFYEPAFITVQRSQMLHKKFTLSGVEVALAHEAGTNRGEIGETKQHGDCSSSRPQAAAATQSSPLTTSNIISPFNAEVKLQYQPVPFNADVPTYLLAADVQAVKSQLDSEQYSTMLWLWSVIQQQNAAAAEASRKAVELKEAAAIMSSALSHSTPAATVPTGMSRQRSREERRTPRAMWVYAIARVVAQRREHRRRTGFSWLRYKDMKAKRQRCAELFTRYRREQLGAPWVDPPSESEVLELRKLEKELPAETVKLARRLALAKLRVELLEYLRIAESRKFTIAAVTGTDKSGTKTPSSSSADGLASTRSAASGPSNNSNSGSSRSGGGGGWFSWWTGSSATTATDRIETQILKNESSPEARAEIKAIIDLMTASKWTEEQRHLIAKEFGFTNEDVQTLESDATGSEHDAADAASRSTSAAVPLINWRIIVHFASWEWALLGSPSGDSNGDEATTASSLTSPHFAALPFSVIELSSLTVIAELYNDNSQQVFTTLHDIGLFSLEYGEDGSASTPAAATPIVQVMKETNWKERLTSYGTSYPTDLQERKKQCQLAVQDTRIALFKALQDPACTIAHIFAEVRVGAFLVAELCVYGRGGGGSSGESGSAARPAAAAVASSSPSSAYADTLLGGQQHHHHLSLQALPILLRADVRAFKKITDFFLFSPVTHGRLTTEGAARPSTTVPTTTPNETTTREKQSTATPKPVELPIPAAPTLTAAEERDLANPKSRLLSLLTRVEQDAQALLDWHLHLRGCALLLVETEGRQASRVVAESIVAHNNIAEKQSRLARAPLGAKLSSSSPSSAGSSANQDSAAAFRGGGRSQVAFGDSEADWHNYATVRVSGLSISAFYQPPFASPSEQGTLGWYDVLPPTPLVIQGKQNILSRRQLQYPAVTCDIAVGSSDGEECGLDLHLSRSRLSVLCTSLSLMIDYIQSVSRQRLLKQSSTNGASAPSAERRSGSRAHESSDDGESSQYFQVQVLSMAKAFMTEDEDCTSPLDAFYQASSSVPLPQYHASDAGELTRTIEIKKGSLAVFHALRPTYVQQYYELVEGHFHVVVEEEECVDTTQTNSDGPRRVTLFVERGGAPHTLRVELTEARRYLEEELGFPQLYPNATLVRHYAAEYVSKVQKSSGADIGSCEQLSPQALQHLWHCVEVVERASHTVPCERVEMICPSVNSCRRLVSALQAAGSPLDQRLYSPSADLRRRFADSIPAPLRRMNLASITLRAARSHIRLIEEEDELPLQKKKEKKTKETASLDGTPFPTREELPATVAPGAEHVLAFDLLQVQCNAFLQSMQCALNFTRCALSPSSTHDRKTASVSQEAPLLLVDGAGSPNGWCTLQTTLFYQLDPLLSIKDTTATLPTVRVRVTSAFMDAAEMLWDLSGIASGRAFSNNIIRCYPWWDPAKCVDAEAEAGNDETKEVVVGLSRVQQLATSFATLLAEATREWQEDHNGGAERKNRARVRIGKLHTEVHYPTDCFERSASSVEMENKSHGTRIAPLCFTGEQVQLIWKQTGSGNSTHMVISNPCVDYHSPLPVSASRVTRLLRPLMCDGNSESNSGDASTATMTIGYESLGQPVTLSLSDAIRAIHTQAPLISADNHNSFNTVTVADAGYHYAQQFTLKLTGVEATLYIPQLLQLVELSTRGLVSRAAAVIMREAYLYTSTSDATKPACLDRTKGSVANAVLRWPRPDCPPAPFVWALMHKQIQLSRSVVWLPTNMAIMGCSGTITDIVALVPDCTVEDTLLLEGTSLMPSDGSRIVPSIYTRMTLKMHDWDFALLPSPHREASDGAATTKTWTYFEDAIRSVGGRNNTNAIAQRFNFSFMLDTPLFSSTLVTAGGSVSSTESPYRRSRHHYEVTSLHMHLSDVSKMEEVLSWPVLNFLSTDPSVTPQFPLLFEPSLAAPDPLISDPVVQKALLHKENNRAEYRFTCGEFLLHVGDGEAAGNGVVLYTRGIQMQLRDAGITSVQVAELSLWDLNLMLAEDTSSGNPESFLHHFDNSIDLLYPKQQHVFFEVSEGSLEYRPCSDAAASSLKFVTSGETTVQVIPSSLFRARDSLCSLRARNAFARLMQWEPYTLSDSGKETATPVTTSVTASDAPELDFDVSLEVLRVVFPALHVDTNTDAHAAPKGLLPFALFSFQGVRLRRPSTDGWTFSIAAVGENGLLSSHCAYTLRRPLLVKPFVSLEAPRGTGNRSNMAVPPVESTTPPSRSTLPQQQDDLLAALFDTIQPVQQQPAPSTEKHADPTADNALSSQHPTEVIASADAAEAPFLSFRTLGTTDAAGKITRNTDGELIIGSAWVMLPRWRDLSVLLRMWSEGGLGRLAQLGRFAEERVFADATDTLPSAPASPPGQWRFEWRDVVFIVPDANTHDGQVAQVQHGMMVSIATLEATQKTALTGAIHNGDEPTHVNTLTAAARQVTVCPLSNRNTRLLQPVDIVLSVTRESRSNSSTTASRSTTQRTAVNVDIGAVLVDVHQRFYEIMLRSFVRNLMSTAKSTKAFQKQQAQSREMRGSAGHSTAQASTANIDESVLQLTSLYNVEKSGKFLEAGEESALHRDDATAEGKSSPSSGTATSAKPLPPNTETAVDFKVGGLRLRVFNAAVDAYIDVGCLKVHHLSRCQYHHRDGATSTEAQLDFDAPLSLDSARDPLRGLPTTSHCVDSAHDVRVTLDYISVGLRNALAPLFDIRQSADVRRVSHARATTQQTGATTAKGTNEMSDLFSFTDAARQANAYTTAVATGVNSPQTPHGENEGPTDELCVTYHRRNRLENIDFFLGRLSVFLDTETITTAIAFLYTPYAQIVLPHYNPKQVKVLDRDTTLHDTLRLNNNVQLHISNRRFNHITVNAAGNELHFEPCGRPLITVDEGVTLRIVNAIVFLKGSSLEYYLDLGNGSYVLIDRHCNSFVLDDDDNTQGFGGGAGGGVGGGGPSGGIAAPIASVKKEGDTNDSASEAAVTDTITALMHSARAAMMSGTGGVAGGSDSHSRRRQPQQPHAQDAAGTASPLMAMRRVTGEALWVVALPQRVRRSHSANAANDVSSSSNTTAATSARATPNPSLNAVPRDSAEQKVIVMQANIQSSAIYTFLYNGGASDNGAASASPALSAEAQAEVDRRRTMDATVKLLAFSIRSEKWRLGSNERGTGGFTNPNTTSSSATVFAPSGSSGGLMWFTSASRGGRGGSSATTSAAAALSAATDLISNWSVQLTATERVGVNYEALSRLPEEERAQIKTERRVDISADSGVEVYLRYSDAFLCAAAMQQAAHALDMASGQLKNGHGGAGATGAALTDVLDKLENTTTDSGAPIAARGIASLSKEMEKANKDITSNAPSTTLVCMCVRVPSVNIHILDDSAETDVPLFHLGLTHIETPGITQHLLTTEWLVRLQASADYYDVNLSQWLPVMDPVPLQLRRRVVLNRTLEDVSNRVGSNNMAVQTKALKFYVSPVLVGCVRRFLLLRDIFVQEQKRLLVALDHSSRNDGAGAGGTAPTQPSSFSEPVAPNVSSSLCTPSGSRVFYSFHLRQDLGELPIHVQFAEDRHGRFPESRVLLGGETFSFNFPRIDGKELPASQHQVLLSVLGEEDAQAQQQVIKVAVPGLFPLTLRPYGPLRDHALVSITVSDGQKVVQLRSNITIENRLTFPIALEGQGMGCVGSRQRRHIPLAALRRPVVFLPQVSQRCHACAMGTTYDMLPSLYGETFLCVTPIVDSSGRDKGSGAEYSNAILVYGQDYEIRRGFQRSVYFYFKVASAVVPESNIYDCHGTFTAPLYIENHLGLPITVKLMVRTLVEGKRLGLIDISPASSTYTLITEVDIPVDGSHGVTEVDPFQDICIDVALRQPSAASLGRPQASTAGRGSNSRQPYPPACVYAPLSSSSKCAKNLTIVDPATGSTLVIRFQYHKNVVTLTVPFWILNQTNHLVQVGEQYSSNLIQGGGKLGSVLSSALSPVVMEQEKVQLSLLAGQRLKDGAGVSGGSPTSLGIPPTRDTPFLVNSERFEKNESNAAVVVRVALPPSSSSAAAGGLVWTAWSAPISIFALTGGDTICCELATPRQRHSSSSPSSCGNPVLVLSYTVELGMGALTNTRVVTFRPQWVLMNETPWRLTLRECATTGVGNVTGGMAAALEPQESFAVDCVAAPRRAATAVNGNKESSSKNNNSNNQQGDGDNPIVSAVGDVSLQMVLHAYECEADPTQSVLRSYPTQSFSICDMGETYVNVRFDGLVRMRDYWPQQQQQQQESRLANTSLSALPPLAPEDIVERGNSGELFVRRSESHVALVVTYVKLGVMYVVLRRAPRPPIVIENRTDFMVYAQQQTQSSLASVYPKRTEGYAWDNTEAPPVLTLWATNNDCSRKTGRISINFDPRRVVDANYGEFYQEIVLPGRSAGLERPGDPWGSSSGQQGESSLYSDEDVVLFVRARGAHGLTYAVSITTEPTIDAYRTLPFAQMVYKMQVESLCVLFLDNPREVKVHYRDGAHEDTHGLAAGTVAVSIDERRRLFGRQEDRLLFCVKPITVYFAQGAVQSSSTQEGGVARPAVGLPNNSSGSMMSSATSSVAAGDFQQLDIRFHTMQLDDERPHAKQKVIAQVVDDQDSFLQLTRKMLRTTPILYVPRLACGLMPVEVHIEDSLINEMLLYLETLHHVWAAPRANTSTAASAASPCTSSNSDMGDGVVSGTRAAIVRGSQQHGWAAEVAQIRKTIDGDEGGGAGAGGMVDWRMRMVLLERVSLAEVFLSVSLYRSPGAENDPMWQRLGVISLLIRSIQDAHIDWPRVDQRGVLGPVWVLAASYAALYRYVGQKQLSNLVSVAGINVIRGFFKDVMGGNAATQNVRRQKPRNGLRASAQLSLDAGTVGETVGGDASVSGLSPVALNDSGIPAQQPHSLRDPDAPPRPPNRVVSLTTGQTVSSAGAPSASYASTANPYPQYGQQQLKAAATASVEELSRRVPWDVFARVATGAELAYYGGRVLERAMRSTRNSSTNSGTGNSASANADSGLSVDVSGAAFPQLNLRHVRQRITAEGVLQQLHLRQQQLEQQHQRGRTGSSSTGGGGGVFPDDSVCRRCGEISAFQEEQVIRPASGGRQTLPHPSRPHHTSSTSSSPSLALTWAEYCHHVSWEEFVRECTPEEVKAHAPAVKAALMGHPEGVIRVIF